MDIRNATQFSTFISQHNLSGLDESFKQIIICMGEFSRACNCQKSIEKDNIYANCHRLYVHGAKLAASKFKGQFLSSITERSISFFNDNGNLICIASR